MTAEPRGVTGVCPVISAAFDSSGAIDLEGFGRIAEYLVASGATSLMVFGVATENAKLADPERDAMLDTLLRITEGTGVKTVATVADHSTELAVARAKKWQDMGANLINILPSYFLSPPHDQVRDHLAAIMEAVDLPVIVQSLPAGGAEVPIADILELRHDHQNLSQIKVENVPAADLVEQVVTSTGGQVTPLVGWGGLEWVECADRGAVGVQPGCSLIEIYLAAQQRLDAGDREGFEREFQPLHDPLHTWMRHVEALIQAEKYVLMRRGIIESDYCRKPSHRLDPLDYQHADRLIDYVTALAGA
jgi:dihydrodipicolinate synthase/N-acetylneuraminate lyase